MEQLRVDERGISERQGNVDMPTPREPSRTTWMRQQYLAADRTEHEIRAERRAFKPLTHCYAAAPYYPGWTRLYPGWTHYDAVQEYRVWHMFH